MITSLHPFCFFQFCFHLQLTKRKLLQTVPWQLFCNFVICIVTKVKMRSPVLCAHPLWRAPLLVFLGRWAWWRALPPLHPVRLWQAECSWHKQSRGPAFCLPKIHTMTKKKHLLGRAETKCRQDVVSKTWSICSKKKPVSLKFRIKAIDLLRSGVFLWHL